MTEPGNHIKFKNLFDHYYSGLVVYASRFTGDRDSAEDIVHDLFIHLWERNDLLNMDDIKSYLFTSIRNRSLNYLKHLKIKNSYQETIIQKGEISGLLTWEYYIEEELRQHIETAINKLAPRSRQIFLMSRFEGKTANEIGAELGLSSRTVEKHIEIALKYLKKELSDYLPAYLLMWLIS